MAEPGAPVGLLLSDDLIFTSRITGTAQGLGLAVTPARTPALLETLALAQPPTCVLLDLACPGLEIAALVRALKAATTGVYLVAYGSHVDTATLRAARVAGCDVVLPRSKFVEELPRRLTAWFAGTDTPS